jgi:hypothetical protein
MADSSDAFQTELVAEGLGSAETAAEIEAALVDPLGLAPRDSIRDRATADLLVAVVHAVSQSGGSPEERAAAAGIVLNVLRSAAASHSSGWGSRDSAMSQSQEMLLDAAIPDPEADGDAKPSLTASQADVVARCLSVTLFSQWELHRAVFGKGAASKVVREAVEESRIVDAPAQPPPLATAEPAEA